VTRTALAGPALEPATCCPTDLATPLDRASADELAQLLKSVADPVRLQLVALIRSAATGEACVCDLTEPVGLSQPTVSHHLKVLVDAGVLARQRRGTWAWYSIVPGMLERIGAVFR
jgi:ArsR family transcriptional regulator, arsenate/arsenite/antimonite-responsive transcriptional repressor